MFWIGIGSILIIFFSSRAYLNNIIQWKQRSFSRFSYFLMQGGNIMLVVAGLVFLMLAIVCHVKDFQIIFSSGYPYHIQIE